MKKILLASKNSDKLKEIRLALQSLPVEIVSLADFDDMPDAVEDGKTFEDNALIKARFFAARTHLACLADDSGLEVDALGGLPGVYSARFSGWHADDRSEEHTSELQSQADYRCALAFVDTDGTEIVTDGKVDGTIKLVPKGSGGFGYDPYFYLTESRTMAEISPAEKNSISHRGAALEKMILKLKGRLP